MCIRAGWMLSVGLCLRVVFVAVLVLEGSARSSQGPETLGDSRLNDEGRLATPWRANGLDDGS